MGERGLAQPGRAEQQHVVERLAAVARGLDEDLELLADLGLAHVFGQALGAQRALDRVFLAVGGLGGDQALGGGGAQLVGFDHGGSLARVQPLDSSFSA